MPINILLNRFTPCAQKYLWVIGFALCAFILFSHLGDMALLWPDEGRNAEVAREMQNSGSWLVPTYNGQTYLDKPAFYFKTVALSFAWFGESEAVARLSSTIFAFLLLIEVFLFCRKIYDQRTAILAILLIASTPMYLAFARIVIFDMTLAFFVCSAIFACYLADETDGQTQKRWYLLGAAMAAIATLVKGPVGFILPTLVMSVFHFWQGRFRVMKQAFSLVNIALFFAIVLPWFVGLSLQCPDFPYYGIMKESVGRFTTTEFHRNAPFYYYALIIAATFFPWSLLLPESIHSVWKNRLQLTKPDKLFIVWAIVMVLFFSVSKSKLPGYILTVTVALGILSARLFTESLNNSAGKFFAIIHRSVMLLASCCLLIGGGMAVLWLMPNLVTEHVSIAKAHQLENYLPFFPRLFCSFFAVALLSAISWYFKNSRLIFASFMSVAVLLLTVNFSMLTHFSESRSAKLLAAKLPHDMPENTELACLECLPNGLSFYSKRLMTVLTKDGKEFTSNYVAFSLHSANPWPAGVVPIALSETWLANQLHPVYLLANSGNLALLETIAKQRGLAVTTLGFDYWAVLVPARLK